MILETYAPESSCQSQIIYKDLQHSSRSWTRRGGHSRSCHTRWSGRHTRWRGQIRRRTIVVSRWEWWWKSVRWDRHAAITRHASSESPMVGSNPAVALAVQDSLSHYRSLLMPQQSQPTIVPSSGHVPLPCPHAPLSSPDVET